MHDSAGLSRFDPAVSLSRSRRSRRVAVAVVLALLSSVLLPLSPGADAQAEAEAEDCSSAQFGDASDGQYFADAVGWAFCSGITSGTSETTFSPNEPVTRAQMATFLWRNAGEPAAASDHPFTDVPDGEYYEQPVAWLAETGITTGTSETTFSPNEPVTRAQMATFLWRSAGEPTVAGDHPFTDVPDGSWYRVPVHWLFTEGITNGTSATTFGPSNILNRAQAVTMLWRIAGSPETNPTTDSGFPIDVIEGVWLVYGYNCPAGVIVGAELIEIVVTGTQAVATKLRGDDCVATGQVSFVAEWDGEQWQTTWNGGRTGQVTGVIGSGVLSVESQDVLHDSYLAHRFERTTSDISPPNDVIEGVWLVEGYNCPAGSAVESELIEIVVTGTQAVATKLRGDDCVATGQVTFVAEWDGHQWQTTWNGGRTGQVTGVIGSGVLSTESQDALNDSFFGAHFVRAIVDSVDEATITHACGRRVIVEITNNSDVPREYELDFDPVTIGVLIPDMSVPARSTQVFSQLAAGTRGSFVASVKFNGVLVGSPLEFEIDECPPETATVRAGFDDCGSEVTAEVNNNSASERTYDIEFSYLGDPSIPNSLTVAGGESGERSRDVGNARQVRVTVTRDDGADTLILADETIDIVDCHVVVLPTETCGLDLAAKVTNNTNRQYPYTMTLFRNGQRVGSSTVDIAAGSTQPVGLTAPSPGIYEVQVTIRNYLVLTERTEAEVLAPLADQVCLTALNLEITVEQASDLVEAANLPNDVDPIIGLGGIDLDSGDKRSKLGFAGFIQALGLIAVTQPQLDDLVAQEAAAQSVYLDQLAGVQVDETDLAPWDLSYQLTPGTGPGSIIPTIDSAHVTGTWHSIRNQDGLTIAAWFDRGEGELDPPPQLMAGAAADLAYQTQLFRRTMGTSEDKELHDYFEAEGTGEQFAAAFALLRYGPDATVLSASSGVTEPIAEFVNLNAWPCTTDGCVTEFLSVDIHLFLDVLGLVPVLGIPADLVNGALYLIEGDKVGAGFVLPGLILPVASSAFARRSARIANRLDGVDGFGGVTVSEIRVDSSGRVFAVLSDGRVVLDVAHGSRMSASTLLVRRGGGAPTVVRDIPAGLTTLRSVMSEEEFTIFAGIVSRLNSTQRADMLRLLDDAPTAQAAANIAEKVGDDQLARVMLDVLSRCGNSFVPGTQVLLADGTPKDIDQVQVGDRVLAADTRTGEVSERLVLATRGSGLAADSFVEVAIDGSSVVSTADHPFWLDDDGRWVDAADLSVGDLLLGVDGDDVRVDGLSEFDGVRRVHNLTVEGVHTYFVVIGEQAVLAHNADCFESALKSALSKGPSDDFTGDELEALWHVAVTRATRADPDAHFGETFDRLAELGYRFDVNASRWSKGGQEALTALANGPAGARGRLPKPAATIRGGLLADAPTGSGRGNYVGDVAENLTADLFPEAIGGASERLIVTVNGVMFEVRPDLITGAVDNSGTLRLTLIESKATEVAAGTAGIPSSRLPSTTAGQAVLYDAVLNNINTLEDVDYSLVSPALRAVIEEADDVVIDGVEFFNWGIH